MEPRPPLDWLDEPCRALNPEAEQAARERQDRLTKPRGALGRLEGLAIRLAGLQGVSLPEVDPVHCVLFAADHGVAAQGVSAYPQAVSAQMVRNIAAGGAAISVLAQALGFGLEVIDCGTVEDPGPIAGVRSARLGPGTQDLTRTPAMTWWQLTAALDLGREAAQRAQQRGARLLIGGEMGIGNTTAAAALGCALLDLPAADLVGPGTGLDQAGVARKVRLVAVALERHRREAGRYPGADGAGDPAAVLRSLGGFEIAALVGCLVRCAQLGIAVLVDGFIVGAAALTACRLQPGARDWLLFAHGSAEPGHARLLGAMDAEPLLDLGLRLGEGSGAALALPLLRLACTLHRHMATFAQAGVAERSPPHPQGQGPVMTDP